MPIIFVILWSAIVQNNLNCYIMVSQTLISFKVDSDNLQRFDLLCDSLKIKRNKMLNFLVDYSLYVMNDPSKFGCLLAYSKALQSFDD